MEDILWIEDIESRPVPPLLTNFRVGMASFVDLRKGVAKMNAFLVFSSTQNESENRKLLKPWKKQKKNQRLT